MSDKNKKVVLICDIGGTNARFGLYHEQQKELIEYDGKYKCADFSSFEEVIEQYFHDSKISQYPQFCLIGAAGDIDETEGKIISTNTPWIADAQKLTQHFSAITHAELVNDFILQGWALSELQPNQYVAFFDSPDNADFTKGKIVVIGPGTGLGTCLIMPDKNSTQNIYTSEAGHNSVPEVTFENSDDEELNQKVLKVIKSHYKKQGPVTEYFVSGTGISNIYHAIKDGEIPEQRISAEDIVKLAEQKDKTALKTLDFFSAYLGAHAGTMIATTKASTIFLSGGVMTNNFVQNYLQTTPYFKDNFIRRSGITEHMKKVKIYASKDENMSSLGAVAYAKKMLQTAETSKEEQDILNLLCSLQAFVKNYCPQAKEPLQCVTNAIKKYQQQSQR